MKSFKKCNVYFSGVLPCCECLLLVTMGWGKLVGWKIFGWEREGWNKGWNKGWSRVLASGKFWISITKDKERRVGCFWQGVLKMCHKISNKFFTTGVFQTFHSYFCLSPRVLTPAHANYCCKNSHTKCFYWIGENNFVELTKLKYLLQWLNSSHLAKHLNP